MTPPSCPLSLCSAVQMLQLLCPSQQPVGCLPRRPSYGTICSVDSPGSPSTWLGLNLSLDISSPCRKGLVLGHQLAGGGRTSLDVPWFLGGCF